MDAEIRENGGELICPVPVTFVSVQSTGDSVPLFNVSSYYIRGGSTDVPGTIMPTIVSFLTSKGKVNALQIRFNYHNVVDPTNTEVHWRGMYLKKIE